MSGFVRGVLIAAALGPALAAPSAAQASPSGAGPAARRAPATPRERDAYWAGIVAGYRAAEARRHPLPGGPYGPVYGYPPYRYAPEPGSGVDLTYAPWAARGP